MENGTGTAGPRGPVEGKRREPILNAPPGTVALCVTLILCAVLYRILGRELQFATIDIFAFVPARFLAQFEPTGPGLSPIANLSLVSHAFLHIGWMHLLLNAGLLLAFGSLVERHLTTGRFVFLFMVCAGAGAVVQALATGPLGYHMFGASGAVFGMVGAAVPLLFFGAKSRRRRDALIFIGVWMALNLLVGLTDVGTWLAGAGSSAKPSQIAWQAHIGGFVAGLVLVSFLRPTRGAEA